MSSFTPATQSTYPQAYAAAYQTPYAHYPPQARYASGNYPPTQSPTASYPLYQPSPAGGAPRADHEPAPQDLSNVDPAVASRSLDKLISFELKNEGFDAAEPAALRKLEAEVVAFIEELHKSAHEYANLANRTAPLAKDALEAVEEVGIELEDLRLVVELSGLRRQSATSRGLIPVWRTHHI
ncbi:hypothetical protein FA95DRAFT_1566187 [Auriscalpium vulgare]|uniref:Uncharacterized protein n=1 Tax=Auriscalpium vulgare TaxID=40419 RepID=A0ACB8R9D9_9AGAM|nr:hypothetical protein FA95DRAFT_1566187 [Auriscalpium vulgare]